VFVGRAVAAAGIGLALWPCRFGGGHPAAGDFRRRPWPVQPCLIGSNQNPKVAVAICTELRGLDAQGLTSTSPQAVERIAVMQGLNKTDAEILTTYVVGLHCPDVR
jgi:hypothetical protein